MKKLILTAFFIWLCFNANSQIQKIKTLDNHYFVDCRMSHPGHFLNLGNNWEIVNVCKSGKSIDELKAMNIKHSQKQLNNLIACNLLQFDNNKYITAFPLFNEKETKEIRAISKNISNDIFKIIEKDFNILMNEVEKQGFKKNLYTILFSYVMDDLVWKELENRKIVTMRVIDVENPFWAGNIWFMAKRNFSCGTNTYDADNNYLLKINWSENQTVLINSFPQETFLQSLSQGKHTNLSLIDIANKYGITDLNGNITVPVIERNDNDKIHVISKKIANDITDYIVNQYNYDEFVKTYNINSKNESIVILFHEIMWDLLDVMQEKNLLSMPIAFSNPEKALNSDLKDIVIITSQEKK